MCYHYSLTKKALSSLNRYNAKVNETLLSELGEMFHINGFQFKALPVLASNNPKEIQFFNWGLIPKWIKSIEEATKFRSNTLNARSESIYIKPSFRNASNKAQRCLIPADGIFEWHTLNKKKYPYFISLKSNEMFSMAGIWEEWTDHETKESKMTFSLVTTDANPLMAKIHNEGQRMPVILPKEFELDWLNENLSQEDVLSFCKPFDENLMQAHSISKLFSSKTENTNIAEIQMPFNYPELSKPLELFQLY